MVIHNVRSCHNVGSLLRTAEGLGIKKVYLTGYTPYPEITQDFRLPHIRNRLTKLISKTALGADKSLDWEYTQDVFGLLARLKKSNIVIAALEQTTNSISLSEFKSSTDLALVVGTETSGLEPEVLAICQVVLEIPMAGKKESFNVAVAAALALYHLQRF